MFYGLQLFLAITFLLLIKATLKVDKKFSLYKDDFYKDLDL